jgi:lytic murein transglycosylase
VQPNLKLPDLVLPGESTPRGGEQHQAEFRAPSAYFAHIDGVVSGGRSRARTHAATLAAIEQRFGVPAGIVLAVWGRESGFGTAQIPHNAFEVLGTKAFLATRKAMFRAEVLAALEMVEKRGVRPQTMRSSWAGALGQPQFLPTSYLKYAVDFDGDGRADIWNSVPDALASIANYLAAHGWVRGRDWGFEVTVPQGVSCTLEGPDQGRPIADWAAMGIARVGGRPFPAHELRGEGYLMMPAGRYGPAFIVTPNFYRLKDYNESDLYALFVGHAGDRIIYGSAGFAGRWGAVDSLRRSDIAAMQRALERQGHDVGGADGLAGFKTRRSIGRWQERAGRTPTCFPDRHLVRELG